MWRILRFQDKKYWTITWLAILFTFLGVIGDLTLPALVGPISGLVFDHTSTTVKVLEWSILFDTNEQGIAILSSVAAFIALIALGVGILAVWFASVSAVNISRLVRKHMFHKIQQLSAANVDRFGPSSLVTRLTNDVNLIQMMAFQTMRVLIRGPFFVIGGFVFALLTNQWLSISIAILVPLLVIYMMVSMYIVMPLFMETQRAVDKINVQSRESLLGVRTVKSFNLEPIQRAKYREVNARWRGVSTRAFTILSLMQPCTTFIVNLSVIVFYTIARFVPAAKIYKAGDSNFYFNEGFPQIQTFLMYQGFIVMGVSISMMVMVNFVRSRAAIKRMNEVLDDPIEIPMVKNGLVPKNSSVTFDHVTFRYTKGGEPILRDISMQIRAGSTIGIIGPTGSGKSSLVSLIARLYDPESGSVSVGDINVKELDTRLLRQTIGHVLQENILFSGTIRSNLLMGNNTASDAEMQRALNIACATNFISRFSDGIDHRVEQRGKNLSGGQKQRISIARTIVRKPSVIILDDSTSALDALTDRALRENIKTQLHGITTIIVAQKILSIREADEIYVLDKGAIVGRGTHDALLDSCPLYREIVQSQLSPEEIAHA